MGNALLYLIFLNILQQRGSSKRRSRQAVSGSTLLRTQGHTALHHMTLRLDGHIHVKKEGKHCTVMDPTSATFGVEGQVQQLMQQAADSELLCQMFCGWMPFV